MKAMSALLLTTTLGMSAATVAARQEASSSPAQANPTPVVVTCRVEHDHGIGSGTGELSITETGIEYRSTDPKEMTHNRTWADADIKRLEISKSEVRVVAYEGGRIVLLPGHFPFGKRRKGVPNGTEHAFNFHLRAGDLPPDVIQKLQARFDRPMAISLMPLDGEAADRLLFEIAVFHRHIAGGESGALKVYEHHLLFLSGNENHSRWWRYADIRDIGRVGRFEFEIATFEGAFGTDGRSFLFDLKRPMTDAEYDLLWKKLYGPGK